MGAGHCGLCDLRRHDEGEGENKLKSRCEATTPDSDLRREIEAQFDAQRRVREQEAQAGVMRALSCAYCCLGCWRPIKWLGDARRLGKEHENRDRQNYACAL